MNLTAEKMKQLIVYINDTSYKQFVDLVKSLSYVRKVEAFDEMTKVEVTNSIKTGLKEVKQFKKGQLKTTSTKDFLNELSGSAY